MSPMNRAFPFLEEHLKLRFLSVNWYPRCMFRFFVLCLLSNAYLQASSYLEGRIPTNNHRYATFAESLRLCEERGVKTMIETGTSRLGESNYLWDGGSTNFLAHYARDHGASFYSVDISEECLFGAAKGLNYNMSNIKLVHRDSVAFLKEFPKRVDFLYLDSYDFEENDPEPSQLHHLREIEAIYPRLHNNSIILIDDCDLPHGGKGKMAIQFLLEKGWKIHMNGYQVLLVR